MPSLDHSILICRDGFGSEVEPVVLLLILIPTFMINAMVRDVWPKHWVLFKLHGRRSSLPRLRWSICKRNIVVRTETLSVVTMNLVRQIYSPSWKSELQYSGTIVSGICCSWTLRCSFLCLPRAHTSWSVLHLRISSRELIRRRLKESESWATDCFLYSYYLSMQLAWWQPGRLAPVFTRFLSYCPRKYYEFCWKDLSFATPDWSRYPVLHADEHLGGRTSDRLRNLCQKGRQKKVGYL